MNQKNFINEWLSAWTGNRPESLLKFYHEDIVYSDPHHKNGLKGKENLASYLKKLLAKNPDWKWSLVELLPVDKNLFCIKWRAEIGRLVEFGMDIVGLKDDLIIRNEVYFDTTQLK